jgi:hypothetical protein
MFMSNFNHDYILHQHSHTWKVYGTSHAHAADIHTHIWTYVCMYVCMYVDLSVCMCIYISTYAHTYIYVYMGTNTRTHTRTWAGAAHMYIYASVRAPYIHTRACIRVHIYYSPPHTKNSHATHIRHISVTFSAHASSAPLPLYVSMHVCSND